MTVKVGQTVAWSPAFATHPLVASGGDPPTPIPTAAPASMARVTFASCGTFGYKCNVHPTMIGAIQVVP